MGKKHKFPKGPPTEQRRPPINTPSKENVLAEAKRLEAEELMKNQQGFIADYNAAVAKWDMHIVAAPALAPAGNGLFALGAELRIVPRPKTDNGT